MTTPPVGSRIALLREGAAEVLRIPQKPKSLMAYFIAAFLLFWLGGWTMGFRTAAVQVMNKSDNAFLFFWLAGWTLGGVFVLYFLYRILRPSVPESFTLRSGGVRHDSGVSPFRMPFNYMSQRDMWKILLGKRVITEFTTAELRTLKLRETDSGNRLTIDKNSERVELGIAASEVEREWLFGHLSNHYS